MPSSEYTANGYRRACSAPPASISGLGDWAPPVPRNSNVYNPMPHIIPEGENAAPLGVIGCTATEKVIIIMVGVSFFDCLITILGFSFASNSSACAYTNVITHECLVASVWKDTYRQAYLPISQFFYGHSYANF